MGNRAERAQAPGGVAVAEADGVVEGGAGLIGGDVVHPCLYFQDVAFAVVIAVGVDDVAEEDAEHRPLLGHCGGDLDFGAVAQVGEGAAGGRVDAARIARGAQTGVEDPLQTDGAGHIAQSLGQGVGDGDLAGGAGRDGELHLVGEDFADLYGGAGIVALRGGDQRLGQGRWGHRADGRQSRVASIVGIAVVVGAHALRVTVTGDQRLIAGDLSGRVLIDRQAEADGGNLARIEGA